MRTRHHRSHRIPRRPTRGDSGASLILALAFLIVVAVVTAALLGFAETAARNEQRYDAQRIERYAGDAALEAGIAWAAQRPGVGIQGAGAEVCFVRSPAQDPAPEVVTTCEANSGSGAVTQQGLIPEYTILTTGQRQNEAPGYRGPTATPSYNGPTCTSPAPPNGGDLLEQQLRGQARIEQGVRFAAAPLESGDLNDPTPQDPCQTASPVSRLLLTGDTYSSSGIQVEPGGEFDVVGGTVTARAACNFVLTTCSGNADTSDGDPMDPASSVEGHDPRTDPSPNGTNSTDHWRLPDVSGLPTRTVPSSGTCTAGGLVVLQPGFYNDVGDLNSLFKAPACATTTFWFQPDPGPDGVIDAADDPAPDDRRGLYYFDFRGSSTGGGCGRYTNITGSVTNAHQWCLGADGSYDQRIIGGSPFNWSQGDWTANPLYNTSAPNSSRAFPREITPDDVGGDCDETRPGVEFVFGGDSHLYVADGSIELCAGPPDNANNPEDRHRFAIYGVPALQPSRASAATAVPAPTGEPSAGQLTATLTAPSDALRIAEPSSTVAGRGKSATINIPNTTCAVTASGSTCPTSERYRAGAVQLSFPGVSIPSGTTVTRVLARATYNTTSATGATGEVPTTTSTNVPDPKPILTVGSCQPGGTWPQAPQYFPTTPNQGSRDVLAIKDVTACFPSGVGSGFTATWTARETEVCTAFGCNGPWTSTLDGIEFIVEVQGTGGPSLVPASGCVTGWAPNVVDDVAANQSPTELTSFRTAASGGSNYWNVENDGDTTCALLKVDQRRYDDATTATARCSRTPIANAGTGRAYACGRASIKGTVYAPSAVLDIADEDVLYAIFNRGIVVRSLMLRGLQYRSPVPFGDAPAVPTGPGARDVTFVACIRGPGRQSLTSACSSADGDRILTRARVRFEIDADWSPVEEQARIPSVQWWRTDR